MTAFFATVGKRTFNDSFRIAFVLHEVRRNPEPELNERIRRLPMTCIQLIWMSRCDEDIRRKPGMGDADGRKKIGITRNESMKVAGSSNGSTNKECHDKRIDLLLLETTLDQLP
jgi:hypothetical protein